MTPTHRPYEISIVLQLYLCFKDLFARIG